MAIESPEYDFVPEFRASLATRQKAGLVTPEKTMLATIATYPPLAHVTSVTSPVVRFLATLEVPEDCAKDPWQVSLWRSVAGGDWAESEFTQLTSCEVPSSLHSQRSGYTLLYFSANTLPAASIDFTVKFRRHPDTDWRWIRDEQGLGDGLVICETPASQDVAYENLGDIIQNLNADLSVKSAMSQCPNTQLWVVKAAIPAAPENGSSAFENVHFGSPWNGSRRWFALSRLWSPWLAPRHGKGPFDLESDALMCAFLGPQGHHLVLLGLSDIDNVTSTLCGSESGSVVVNIRNDSTRDTTGIILASVGKTFDNALANAMYHARGMRTRGNSQGNIETQAENVEPQWLESWYDGLGYCTWNALGPELTSDSLEDALETLSENNINITSLIIDDGWQDIQRKGHTQYQQGWHSFEADSKSFPGGLKQAVSDIRAKHSNIQHIAVWHALFGYWGGIAPGGPLAIQYETIDVQRQPSGRPDVPLDGTMTVVGKNDVSRFYNDFYQFLEDCGIDGVKTDVQFMVDMLEHASDRRELIDEYLDAWVIASLRHFSLRVISCMSQVPQIIFHEQMPRNRPALVVRNSDDFYPNVPAAHPWHLWANAHNSLLTQHLNVLPDWDMFQTDHEYGGFHAAARCISGGPIYITDIPGQHDIDLIKQISGTTVTGKTVTFRPSVVGKSIDQYHDYHDNTILKVGSYNGRAYTGTPLLGVFNVSSQRLAEIVPLSRFPGTVDSLRYIVRSHVAGKVSSPMTLTSPAADMIINLDICEYDILTAYPVKSFATRPGGEILIANLGLVGKMTGAAAIIMNDIRSVSENKFVVDTRLMALGQLGIYISHLPTMSIEDNFMVTILGQPIPPHTVSIDGLVLHVDVETAWKEMELNPGWSNEVGVKVYISVP